MLFLTPLWVSSWDILELKIPVEVEASEGESTTDGVKITLSSVTGEYLASERLTSETCESRD